MNQFQERLQDLIEEEGLSRLQLAKKLNISSTTLNGYFNNDYYPQIEIALSIADYFDCSLDYLFGFSESKTAKININIDLTAENFIINFNSLLKENNVSIAKTMKELGMSEYNYYRWKNGKFPKTVNLIAIANYFETSICFLIGKNGKTK